MTRGREVGNREPARGCIRTAEQRKRFALPPSACTGTCSSGSSSSRAPGTAGRYGPARPRASGGTLLPTAPRTACLSRKTRRSATVLSPSSPDEPPPSFCSASVPPGPDGTRVGSSVCGSPPPPFFSQPLWAQPLAAQGLQSKHPRSLNKRVEIKTK